MGEALGRYDPRALGPLNQAGPDGSEFDAPQPSIVSDEKAV